MPECSYPFFFQRYCSHRYLHSFPTRRSSDLPPLTLDEARVWASVVAASGGMTILSDNLPKLPAERLPVLQKTLPVARTTRPARVVGTQVDEHEIAPALVAGDTVVPLRGPWRFRTGDDQRYAAREFDDETV